MKDTYLDAEDDDGLAQVKKLSCDLGGLNGVREVQQLFIKLRKLRKLHHRLKTKQRQIIIWLTYNIRPANVRRTVQDTLKQDTRQGRLAAKKLKHFHKLLMKVAKTFQDSIQLGVGLHNVDNPPKRQNNVAKTGNNNNNNNNSNNNRNRNPRQRNKDNKGNGTREKCEP